MASLINGFEYDIFISYRQKDNKHDGWVTEFVNQLKGELESTFKQDISVYFDINLHDGLLETHDVDASLKNKLKCLVFIPIISRTYCDTKSFAWEHEFKAFVEQATNDQFGLKIRLPNGNVASRILPIQIHDLDSEDIKLCESILGGVLRGVDFIYKSSGVNRPLLSKEENPRQNLNHTFYRDQVNKVANAIKDIVYAIEKNDLMPGEVTEKASKKLPGSRIGNRTKITAGSIIVLLLIVFGFFLIPKLSLTERVYEKSIAVLPFFNDSPDEANIHFMNGIMDEILNNLQVIKDLRVISRSSVEQYRGITRPSAPKIAKDLDVNYIVEGSGQKYGDVLILRVQLIEAVTDKHLWAKAYEQKIKKAEDIFHLQSLIAEAVASELKAIITPDEKELIGKISTSNITAYDLYFKANEFSKKYDKTRNLSDYQTAVNLYKTAFEIDSTFARAYAGLAGIYGSRYYFESYFKKDFLDSTLILANKALLFDDQLDLAYYIKAQYYRFNGLPEECLENLNKAIKINPNYYQAYSAKGSLLARVYKDYVKGIDNYHKALNLCGGNDHILLLRNLGRAYLDMGFIEKSKYYYIEALNLDNDSAAYFGALAWLEFCRENFEEALEFSKRSKSIDTSRTISIEYYTCLTSNYREEAFLNVTKRIERLKKAGFLDLQLSHRLGYTFWQMGRFKEAEDFFNQQIKYGEESIILGREISQNMSAHYDLAATYAFLGKKEKAYKYLEDFGSMNTYPLWWVSLIKNDPLFNGIRHEEKFQNIQRRVESKHQVEHERVRKWLEEQEKI